MTYEEKTVSRKSVYKGSIIDVYQLEVILPNGKKAKRDVVNHSGASVIIPLNKDNEIYVVRQYRKPVDRMLIEIPAGKLDSGEDPLVCAKRELKEETGLDAKSIKYILSIHSTPGFSNEILHIFAATNLSIGKACTDEDEFLTTEKIHINKLIEMIFCGEITDAKTIIGIFTAQKILNNEIEIK
jgi:ADP-ribose pyrophosphatase